MEGKNEETKPEQDTTRTSKILEERKEVRPRSSELPARDS